MSKDPAPKLDLTSLADRIPVFDAEALGFYKNNCMICFDTQGHQSGVRLEVHYRESLHFFEVCWPGQVTEELRIKYRDLKKAPDFAA